MRAPDGLPNRPAADIGSDVGSDISVLAGVPADRDGRGALRLGARVFPLRRWMARRHAVVGAEVAVTATLLDQLPTSPTVVIVVAPGVAAATVVDQLLPAAHGMLTAPGETGALTLGIASPDPVRSATAGTLAMYNQHLDALPEALVEAIAAGRRCGLVTPHGNCVLLLQPFVPATASAVVHASPDRRVPVRIDGRWGLTEATSPADTFEVPADGSTIRETLAWKPDAHVVAPGGTRSVSLPVSWRYRYSLGRATVRQLAALSRDAAVTAGRPLTLDIALGAQAPVVLRCRPARA
jgi:hypothetical protein